MNGSPESLADSSVCLMGQSEYCILSRSSFEKASADCAGNLLQSITSTANKIDYTAV